MIEFTVLAAALVGESRSLLPSWFPAGKWRGREFVVGSLSGDPGESLSINHTTGQWADFASGEKGGDLISLYAAIHHLSQGDAAAQLEKIHAYTAPSPRPPQHKRRDVIQPVPKDAPACACMHYEYGKASRVWDYRNEAGELLGHIARYDLGGGKKEIIPWTYGAAPDAKPRWGMGSWPEPRPLYGVDDPRFQDRSVPLLIVEGEKSADAARQLVPGYVVLTWPGGSKSWKKADFKQLSGRKEVLLWPDADDAGIKCMWEIGHHLFRFCEMVKIIIPEGQSDGWDAADAVAEGWNWERFKEWAVPRRKIIAETGSVEDQPKPEPVTITSEGRPNTIVGRWMAWGLLGPNNSSGGQPYSDLNNAVRVLEVDPLLQERVWYDEFLGRMLTMSNPHPREWREIDDINLTLYLQRDIGLKKISDVVVGKAVTQVAFSRVKNCVRDWMQSLKWDGEARLDDFFSDYFGSENTPYTRAAGRNFWIALAARTFRPGCQMDNVIVLEGKQGSRKTSALRAIGGEWYAEQAAMVHDTQAFAQNLQGKLLVEIAEMDSFRRGEITAVKAAVTRNNDFFRVPYGRRAEDHPRRCVFTVTTNLEDWNKDETGARRFWPIRCTDTIDVDGILAQREQLFAEAVHRFKANETWWEMPEEATEAEQRKRYDADVWFEPIQTYLALKTSASVLEILVECLGRKQGECTHSDKLRVTACLRAMAWHGMLERSGRNVQRVWRRNDG